MFASTFSGTSTRSTDPVRRAVQRLEDQTGFLDPRTRAEVREAGDLLASLTPKQRTEVLSLVSDGVARDLGEKLSGLRQPTYRQMGQAIQARYSKVMGIRVEAPPEKKEAVHYTIRRLFAHRPDLGKRVGLILRRLVVGPTGVHISKLPETPWGSGVGRWNGLYASVSGTTSTSTIVHELGHALHAVLSPVQHWTVLQAYRRAEGEKLMSGYGETDIGEFFAEALEMYVTGHNHGGTTRFTPKASEAHLPAAEQLAKYHPEMYALLKELVGEPGKPQDFKDYDDF